VGFGPGERLTQNFGEPSVNKGGQTGGPRGRSPLAGGLGDVPPKTKKGASRLLLQTRYEWDPKR